MRVLVVDPDPARAALVAEGLAGVEPLDVRQTAVFDPHEAAVFEPDVIVVASDSPDRDTIDSLRQASVANPRPVVMFVDRSEPGLAEQAVRAGVSAYVVAGLSAATTTTSGSNTAASCSSKMAAWRTSSGCTPARPSTTRAARAGSGSTTRTRMAGGYAACGP